MALVFSKHDPFIGLNAGFVALCVNAVVTVVAIVLTPAQQDGFNEPGRRAAASAAAVSS
jgi:hypothetical protein